MGRLRSGVTSIVLEGCPRSLRSSHDARSVQPLYNGAMGRLLLLFIVVPAVELALLIELGSRLGTLPTLGLIALTGIVGAYLARRQGLSVLRRAQEQMNRGELPAGSLGDGVMILIAGALLMTPGILTDVLGFSLLVPRVRAAIKSHLQARFRKAVEEQRIHVHVGGAGFDPFQHPGQAGPSGQGPIVDVTPELDSEPFDDEREPPKYKVH